MFRLRCLVDNNSLDVNRWQAEHGLAFAIETADGQILFDTGQSGSALLHNAIQMEVDLGQLNALALSHAHYDHTGGIESFLQKSQPGLPIYAHTDLFRERYSIKDGQVRNIGLQISQTDLAEHVTFNLSSKPTQILPGIWTTGEITSRKEFEGRSSHHYIRADQSWQPDPYQDDMALVLEARAGLILVCGCCHAGLLNTMAQVQRIFNQKIIAIVGGTHLGNLDAYTLDHAITTLQATSVEQLPDLFLNHCTGSRALAALTQAFGEKAQACPAGTVLKFS